MSAPSFRTEIQDEVDAPQHPSLRFLRWCFLAFLLSFAFDYRDHDILFDSEKTGGSLFQFAFLGLALGSSALAVLTGWRFLLVRPGTWMVLLWGGYVAFMVTVALMHGNDPSRVFRLIITPLLVLLGISVTQIVACAGMRPGEAARWVILAGCVNVLWRFTHGMLFSGLAIDEVRMEILSPAMNFLFAWVGASLLLRRRFTLWIIAVLAVPMIPTVFSITRSIFFPMAASAVASAICLLLGMMWKLYPATHPARKIGAIAGVAAAAVLAVVIMAIAQPIVIERWMDRMFHNSGAGEATTEDLSALMRKAEAKSMIDILAKEPASFVYGRGPGASYYWDESYFPELFMVYPEDRHQFAEEIFTAGHSIWTYTLFSSGIIGILIVLGTFFITMGLSLRAAWRNSRTVMGRWAWDAHLMFLPFVSMLCLLSESITRNPFDERFTGVLLGFMIALPQFFFNRAFFLQHREQEAALTPQLIITEDDLPTHWQGAFPGHA
jgi:hypothetical protein